jgi:VanZ family protein
MGSTTYNPMLYRAVFWVMCVGIFVLAMLPNNPSSIAFLHADKIVHAMAFGGLSLLGGLAYPGRIYIVAAFLIFLGGAIEVAQGFTPDRSQELFDFFADLMGISLGLLAHRFWDHAG